jgi:hypothetical protein
VAGEDLDAGAVANLPRFWGKNLEFVSVVFVVFAVLNGPSRCTSKGLRP